MGRGLIMESFLGVLAASLFIPFAMATLTPQAARRVLRAAWLVLLPIHGIGCIAWTSRGEGGFLGRSQFVTTGALFLILSFGIGYLAAKYLPQLRAR